MPEREAGTGSATRVRFALANLSILLDEVVFFALAPLLPLYAARFSLSKAEAGLLFAAYPLLSFAAAIPGSLLCGRLGPRLTLIVANLVFAVATLGFGLANGAAALWTARGLQGFASGVTVVAAMMLVTAAGRSGRAGRVLGMAFALQGLSAIVGPALGGIAVPRYGATATFSVIAAVALTSAVVLLASGGDGVERTPARGALRRFARDARGLAMTPTGRYPALLFVGVGVSAGCVQTLATLRLGDLGVTTSGIGVIFMIAGLAAMPIVLAVGWLCDHVGPVRATRWWLGAEVLLCLALAVPVGVWLVVPALSLLLIQGRSGGTIAYAQAAGTDRATRMAVGFGFMIMAWAIGSTLGAVLAGSVAEAIGDTAAYVLTAIVLILVVGPGATLDLRGRDRL